MADLVRIGLDGAVDVVAEGGTWDSPMPVAQGVVAIHEALRLAGVDHLPWS